METGVVVRLNLDRGYGFIRLDDGRGDTFFHARALSPSLPFDETLQERRVCCEVEQGDKGWRASRVVPER